MQMVDLIGRAAKTLGGIPTGSRYGLLIIGLGIVADLVAHLGPGVDHDHGLLTGPQLSAHFVVFLGMVLVLAAVVIDGVRASHRVPGAVIQGRH
jgi:hypothetical protein